MYFCSIHLGRGLQGVRYVTKELICKLTKQTDLAQVTNLNLMLAKEGGKKIKVCNKTFTHICVREEN